MKALFQEGQPGPEEAAALCLMLRVHGPDFQSTAHMPEGPSVYWVLVMTENHLVNVIIDSKRNILKLLFREDKTHN